MIPKRAKHFMFSDLSKLHPNKNFGASFAFVRNSLRDAGINGDFYESFSFL